MVTIFLSWLSRMQVLMVLLPCRSSRGQPSFRRLTLRYSATGGAVSLTKEFYKAEGSFEFDRRASQSVRRSIGSKRAASSRSIDPVRPPLPRHLILTMHTVPLWTLWKDRWQMRFCGLAKEMPSVCVAHSSNKNLNTSLDCGLNLAMWQGSHHFARSADHRAAKLREAFSLADSEVAKPGDASAMPRMNSGGRDTLDDIKHVGEMRDSTRNRTWAHESIHFSEVWMSACKALIWFWMANSAF